MNIINLILAVSITGCTLVGCDDSEHDSGEIELANGIVNSMIVIKGGRFQMGDFGPLVGEGLPFSPDQDNKPLHWVELSD